MTELFKGKTTLNECEREKNFPFSYFCSYKVLILNDLHYPGKYLPDMLLKKL